MTKIKRNYGRRKSPRIIRPVAACLLAFCFVSSVSADTLFNRIVESRGALIASEKTRFQVGDIITILISENTDARTQTDTDTEKQADLVASGTSDFLTNSSNKGLNIINKPELPNWNFSAQNEFEAEGQTSRRNQLRSTISVQVARVYTNGNLYVEGAKTIVVNREKSEMKVTGIIRPQDVQANNTVISSNIADLTIDYVGKGPLWNNQRRGFVTKLLDWVFPF